MRPGQVANRVLDRPGGRTVLASLASAYSVRTRGRWTPIKYRDGLWVHEVSDGVIVDRRVDFSSTLADFERRAEDYYSYCYRPREGDVVIDIGAGIGTDVSFFSEAVSSQGLVVAIEAHPETYRCLEMFCTMNSFDNVRPVRRAIMDTMGHTEMDDPLDHIATTIVGGQGTVTVPASALDDMTNEIPPGTIDFVKINIEGAELLALQGMRQVLARTSAICVCCHDFIGFQTKERVRGLLEEHSFEVITRETDSRPWIRDQLNGVRTGPQSPPIDGMSPSQ